MPPLRNRERLLTAPECRSRLPDRRTFDVARRSPEELKLDVVGIAHDPAALLLAEDGGRVVGSVIAGWDGWRESIYRLVVAPGHRRQGLGRQLLAAAEERLQDAGAVRAQAIVVEIDAQATSFWNASGWEQQAERLRFVKG